MGVFLQIIIELIEIYCNLTATGNYKPAQVAYMQRVNSALSFNTEEEIVGNYLREKTDQAIYTRVKRTL
jgi:hypothetical protein